MGLVGLRSPWPGLAAVGPPHASEVHRQGNGVWIILFFGVTFIVYGLAVAMSDNFPKWMGWIAAALGLVSLVAGLYQSYDGLSVFITSYVFSGTATLLTVWGLVMAILMARKTMQAKV